MYNNSITFQSQSRIMGYLSCNAKSAIATCDSYNWELLSTKPNKTNKPYTITKFDYSILQSSTNAFSHENLLGKGSYGSVYKSHIRLLKLTAAVKVTKQTHPAKTAENEVKILSTIHHPRLVNLLGYAIDPNHNRKLIVVEYMPNGSLHELLHGPGKPPGWVKRTKFMLQIARAVQFLHESCPPIIHRDIKSTNVLIDSSLNSRLSDFGLAMIGHAGDVHWKCTPPAGTLGYLDPTYLVPSDLSAKSDVYSFGILMMEVISGRKAIDVNYSPPSVIDWVLPMIKSGDYTSVCDARIGAFDDDDVLKRMVVMAARCVRSKVEKRPEMAEVVECLKGVYGRTKRWSRGCTSLGKGVVEYEALEEECGEGRKHGKVGCMRNGKVSSVSIDKSVLGKSKSIGSTREVKFSVPLPDIRRKAVLGRGKIPMVMKSRSMGITQGKRMVSSDIGDGAGELEEFKLLGDLKRNHVKRRGRELPVQM